LRPTLGVRELRRGHAAVGALMIGIPATAGALPAGQALADTVAGQTAPSNALAAHVKSSHITYGSDVVVAGTAPSSDAGHELQLQFSPSGSSSWSTETSARARSDGHFRLAAPLRRSGLVRVIDSTGSSAPSGPVANVAAAPSSPQSVSVAASLRVPARDINLLGGQSVDVGGKLLPGIAGRRVRLQGRQGGAWHTLASARTRSGGRFDLRYSAGAVGQQQLRVRFAGDRLNSGSGTHAGQLTVYRESVASWYNDGGTTGCGFHATYGVANKDLPCGTNVTFSYGGRTVTATVDDRGPYVGGREWDLNQNTAAALGFAGVGTIWSSV
jgi:rare lipoprotein A